MVKKKENRLWQPEKKFNPSLTQYHVTNITCIHYEGSRPKYIQVVLANMLKTSYTLRKYRSPKLCLTELNRW